LSLESSDKTIDPAIISTAHFMDDAENCDEIALIYNGKIRASGTPDYLKSLCKCPTLERAFISIINATDNEAT
jgi:ABC-2 type transport system ATP-binding protein